MIKKLLIALLISISVGASGATIYRDRFIPNSICLVTLGTFTINASLIQEIRSGTFSYSEYTGEVNWAGVRKTRAIDKNAVQIQLVNGHSYSIFATTAAEAEEKKLQFIKLIHETCIQ